MIRCSDCGTTTSPVYLTFELIKGRPVKLCLACARVALGLISHVESRS